MNDIARITSHLCGRPIARIFEQSREKDTAVALKLMCILDFHIDRSNLYTQIQATNPKLLAQLMKFHTFASYRFFDYAVNKDFAKRILRCKFCDLVGRHANILSHMAINHNCHIGLKMCVYCNRVELKKL